MPMERRRDDCLEKRHHNGNSDRTGTMPEIMVAIPNREKAIPNSTIWLQTAMRVAQKMAKICNANLTGPEYI